MKVIVDTSIWSLALHKNSLEEEKQYRILKHHLQACRDLDIETEDYELATEYFNTARKKGIQASYTDFLICALSVRRHMPIFTADRDFINLQSVIPIALHKIRTS